jgi:hypothetical protein
MAVDARDVPNLEPLAFELGADDLLEGEAGADMEALDPAERAARQ